VFKIAGVSKQTLLGMWTRADREGKFPETENGKFPETD